MFVWNGEVAALVGNSTTKQRGVSRIEDSNIGVCQWLALFVDNGSCQVAVGLVGTLNEDFLFLRVTFINYHADGIKAYHLLDGIGKRLAMDGSGDAKVLQFVVEEHDDVVGLLLGELAKDIRERYIIIHEGDTLLGLCADSQQQSKKDKCNISVHGC